MIDKIFGQKFWCCDRKKKRIFENIYFSMNCCDIYKFDYLLEYAVKTSVPVVLNKEVSLSKSCQETACSGVGFT